MTERLTVYIVGDYKSGAADGLAEFNYQNVTLLRDTFSFEFIEFDSVYRSEYYEVEDRGGIAVHRFGIKDLPVFKLPNSFILWLNKLDAGGRVFHLSHIWNIWNYLIARRLVTLNRSYLITPHDSYVYDPLYSKAKPLFKQLYRRIFVRIFDKYVLDHARIVHALTSHCIPSLERITDTRIIVVENQISDARIPLIISQIKQQVCFIGRVKIVQKGIDLALEAFARFKDQPSGKTVRFVLVGPADLYASDTVDAICESLELRAGEDVVFTGKISESERNLILGESKVYLQLSRFEGFGLSVGQALLSYKPVVVSAGIPISSTIAAYNAGFVVNNAVEAAEALKKLFSLSAEEYLEMAMNARRCYEDNFHPDVIKPKLTALYQAVFQ